MPSSRIVAVLTMMSPVRMPGRKAALLPTRMKCEAPTLASSSTAMAAEGQPIPVDVPLTPMPAYDPVAVRYSRL